MDDLIEFYVSCNPPLRPNGVKYVLDQLRESKIEYIEVLYEPTVPWMQCLVTKRQRNALANFLTSRLHDILVRETGDFELDPQAGDIEIVADDPMILSWGAFLQLGQKELDEYEPYRYPDAFRRFSLKSIWQRLRSMDVPQGLDVMRLLQREGDPEWSFKAFMDLSGCQASYNIQQDVLYLGCDTRTLLEKATRKLNSLFEVMRHATPPATQLVLPAAAGNDWRLSLRPISTLGLAKSTIIRTTAVTAKNDYRDLYVKGVVVTYAFADLVGDGRGVPERELVDQAPVPRKSFVAFVDYSYPTKEATAKPGSSVDTTADHTLPQPVSHDTAAIIADWVRETGEAHGTDEDRLLSGAQPAVLDEHNLQAHELGEEDHRPPEDINHVPNLLEREDPCPEAGPVLDIWSPQTGSVPREAVRRGVLDVDQLWNMNGLSTPNRGDARSINGAASQTSRAGHLRFLSSAVADLVGLSIPTVEETMASKEEEKSVYSCELERFTRALNSKTSNNGDVVQHKSRATSQTQRKPIVRDLLDMVDEPGLQNLMAPMMPRGRSPPREYRHTMNQRAARKERGREQRNNQSTARGAGRVSPSPPPSLRAKSRIPIRSTAAAKSCTATPSAADTRAIVPQRTSLLAKDRFLEPMRGSSVPRGAHLRGNWNTGIGGKPYVDVTLSFITRASIEKRVNFEKALEETLVGMARRAKMLVGKVSLEIVFGRIVMNNVHEDAINLGGMDSFEPSYTPIRFLQELAVFNMDDLLFHSILSLDGSDANKLQDIHWTSDEGKKWALDDKQVFYDFNCRDLGSNCCFTIQVNAEDFTIGFESSQKYTTADGGFIHCPSRAWDLAVYLKRTDSAYFEDKYESFAKSLVESLAVPTGLGCGNPRLSFDEHGKYRVSVDQVRVRHVARYRDGHRGNTFLNITMWQATNMDWDAVDDSNRTTRHIRVEPSANDDTKGLANTWYEASISSARAERVFEENARMEFGDAASWTEEKLKEEGVFKNLYLPSIGMLEQMDGIGSGNDNGRNPFAGTVSSVADTKIGELKKGLFW